MRLLYHALLETPGDSPFDDAILQVARRDGPIGIVSPYIGVSYIERITGLNDDWRLISDVEEWLSSLSYVARPRAWGFIRENLDRIHHCPALHAKVVISQSLAMIGSANLTSTGILGRTEMGMLIDDVDMVAELNAWFDGLWLQTSSPVVDEASAFVQWLDAEWKTAPARRQKISLSSGRKTRRAKLVKLPKPPVAGRGKLDLSNVAEKLVTKEVEHYDTTEAAVEAVVDNLSKDGAIFGDITRSVMRSCPSATTREIYWLVLQRCTNHVRSVFGEDTHNRLTIVDGRFMPSDDALIRHAAAPFDAFLVTLIRHLDFTEDSLLPGEVDLEEATGFAGAQQVILVAELVDIGLLTLVDIPGELPHYRLAPNFEWPPRFVAMFRQAQHD